MAQGLPDKILDWIPVKTDSGEQLIFLAFPFKM